MGKEEHVDKFLADLRERILKAARYEICTELGHEPVYDGGLIPAAQIRTGRDTITIKLNGGYR